MQVATPVASPPAPHHRLTVQDSFMQVQSQPFIKLTQANMALLTRFSVSPEVTAQATANAGQLFQQACESAMKLSQSGAFSQLMQGMLRNYTEFVAECGQSGMAWMLQGPAALTRQMQDVANAAPEATVVRAGRVRAGG